MLSYYYHLTNLALLSRDNKFAQRRGDIGRKLDKRRKLRDPEDVYYEEYDYDGIHDRTNAFGYDDYNDRFRDILDKHYDKTIKTKNNVEDDYYDYEDYSYNHFFQKTFLPQINNNKKEKKPSTYFDPRPGKDGPQKSYSDIKKDKSEILPRTFKLEDKRKKPSSIKDERIEKRRYDKLEVTYFENFFIHLIFSLMEGGWSWPD